MDERYVEESRPLWWWLVAAAGIALILVGGYFYFKQSPAPKPVAEAPVAQAPAPAPAEAPAAPVIEHPVEAVESPVAEPPPPVVLDESDATLLQALGHLVGADRLGRWLAPESVVRRIVATVDNIPRQTVAMKIRAANPVPGAFEVARDGDVVAIGTKNAARYTPYVEALERVDSRQLAGVYLRFYPLFQQAYEELGYPKAYFNDRLVASIDHLLATPEPTGPLLLQQPKVLYEFADPELESLSAGQKTMLRMGPDNARRVKAKLRSLRAEVTARGAAAKN
jgi:hypothetical protein